MQKIIPFALTLLVSALMSSAQAADTAELWTKNCASCHGKDGKGQTKAGIKAKVKDLTDAKHQESFSDDKALKSVKEGIKENEKERMKAYSPKLTDDEIKALVAHVRKFKK